MVYSPLDDLFHIYLLLFYNLFLFDKGTKFFCLRLF